MAAFQHQPLLYVSRLPVQTTDNELAELLKECLPVRLGIKRDEVGQDGCVEGLSPAFLFKRTISSRVLPLDSGADCRKLLFDRFPGTIEFKEFVKGPCAQSLVRQIAAGILTDHHLSFQPRRPSRRSPRSSTSHRTPRRSFRFLRPRTRCRGS